MGGKTGILPGALPLWKGAVKALWELNWGEEKPAQGGLWGSFRDLQVSPSTAPLKMPYVLAGEWRNQPESGQASTVQEASQPGSLFESPGFSDHCLSHPGYRIPGSYPCLTDYTSTYSFPSWTVQNTTCSQIPVVWPSPGQHLGQDHPSKQVLGSRYGKHMGFWISTGWRTGGRL